MISLKRNFSYTFASIQLTTERLHFIRELNQTLLHSLQRFQDNFTKTIHNQYFQLLIIGLLLHSIILTTLLYKQKNDHLTP